MKNQLALLLAILTSFSTFSTNGQSTIASQLNAYPDWYNGISNDGSIRYSTGQTFKSLVTATMGSLEINFVFPNSPGSFSLEIYSFTPPNLLGPLLGTKTNIPIGNNPGNQVIDISLMDIAVTSGNHYAFLVVPDPGTNQGLAISNGDAYADGQGFQKDEFSETYFNDDLYFKILAQESLPVSYGQFNVTQRNGTAELQWQTLTEQLTSHFDILHSKDGTAWSVIGKVNAKGNSNMPIDYNFLHHQPSTGDNYYRLAQVDADGSRNLSAVKKISVQNPGKALVLINPIVNGLLQLELPEVAGIKIFSAFGALKKEFVLAAGRHSVPISNLPKGNYYISINGNAQTIILQ